MLQIVAALVLCASPDAELIASLNAKWDAQRTAIKTAHIVTRAFRSGDVKPLSASDIKALFNSVDLAQRPDDLRQVVAKLWKYEVTKPDPWILVEVTVDGNSRLRERYFYVPGQFHDNVVDGGIMVIGNRAANQVSITPYQRQPLGISQARRLPVCPASRPERAGSIARLRANGCRAEARPRAAEKCHDAR